MLVVAHADGGFTSEASIVPARVEQNGTWVPENTDLARDAQGWVSPVAAAAPVQFSPGGGNDLARVRSSDGSYVTESWPYGSLPAPVVADSTATYADVLPDVDLKLSATEVGMSEVLVVKTPEAQANPELKSLTFKLHGAKSSIDAETKTVEATTASGAVIGSGTPLWWDSSADGAAFDTAGDAEPKALSFTTPSADTVSLNVSSVTSSPAVQYPVYVDPDWSTNNAYLMADWYDDRAFPEQSYFDPPEDSVGYGIQDGVGYLSRAFFQFNTANLAGKTINGSHLGMLQTYANSCDTTLVQAWRYDSTSTGFAWNHETPAWAQLLDQQGDANGGPCAPNAATVGWDVTQGTSYAASHSLGSLTLGLRVADEGNSLTRKHYQWNATLVTTYDTPPAAPASLKFAYASPVGSKACGTAANPTIITTNGQNLPMAATLSDSDMPTATQALRGVFYVNDMQGAQPVAVASQTIGPGASGSVFNWNWAPGSLLHDGDLYKWYVVPSDGILAGPHSIDCYFRDYINPPPGTGTVSFPTGTPAPAIGTVDTVSLTMSATDRVAGYMYWSKTDDAAGPAPVAALTTFVSNVSHVCDTQTVNPDGTVLGYVCKKATTTVDVPMVDANMSLGAVPFDAAGNYGAAFSKSATFSADPNASFNTSSHAWYFDGPAVAYDPSSALPATFSDANTVNKIALHSGNGAVPVADTTDGAGSPFALSYSGAAGKVPTATDPVRLSTSSTAGPFSVSVWVKPADATGTYTALWQKGISSASPSFTLQVVAGHPSFCVYSQLAGSSKHACATAANDTVSTGGWTMLTGVWDERNDQVRVDFGIDPKSKGAVAFQDDAADPGCSSPVVLGSGVDSSGLTTSAWKGELSDPVVVSGVVSAAQLKAISTRHNL